MRILITYTSAGIGHQAAAQALSEAFADLHRTDVEVSVVDSLEYTNRFFKWTYPKIYLLIVNFLPGLWGFLYYFSDQPRLYPLMLKLRRFLNGLNSQKLARLIASEKPDLIISTHFFSSEIIAHLKRSGRFNGELVTTITDFGIHSFWILKETDAYIAATEDLKTDLISRGVEEGKIRVLGIPISAEFKKELDRRKLCLALDIKADLFTILLIGGGFGVGPIRELVKVLETITHPIQLIAVCGRNRKLFKDLTRLGERLKTPMKIYGFTQNINELMAVSDVIITKPGGLTTSEALVKGLPMIIISPIPGQEVKNCNFVVRHDAGIRADKASQVGAKLTELLSSPHKLLQMKEDIKKVAKPNAAADVAQFVFSRGKS